MQAAKNDNKTDFKGLAKVGALGLLLIIGLNVMFLHKKFLNSPPDEVHFTQSAWMYFSNVRSYYYTRTEDTVSGFLIFKHRKFTATADAGDLHLQLIVNPAAQSAYLYPDLTIFGDTLRKLEIWAMNDTLKLFPAETSSLKGHFSKLNTWLEDDADVYLLVNEMPSSTALYQNKKARKNLAQMIFDYMKLTSGK